jgi:hypothetical protein
VFRLDVVDRGRMEVLARDCRRAGNGLPRRVGRALRKPTKQLGEAVREAIMGADMRAGRVRGAAKPFPDDEGNRLPVKAPTAAAVKWSVRLGASPQAAILFNPNRIPGRVQPLFPYWVGQKKRLAHPLMGRRSTWIRQQIPDVWKQTKLLLPLAQSATGRVLDETADIIAGR